MKLIKLTNYHYIIVDNSEIKVNDWFFNTVQGNIYCNNIPDYNVNKDYLKKITHSTQPFELLSENGLSGMGFSKVRPLNIFEVKELLGVVDVEKKAINSWEGCDSCDTNDELFFINGYQKGYNQALEDNKDKKYTEKDIDKAYWAGMQFVGEDKGSFGEFIQSLQPKTEWEVEFVNDKLKLK